MQIDLIGRVRNTKLSRQHALLPLFEAVVNSLHACSDLPSDTPKPHIRIHLIRSSSQATLPEAVNTNSVESFEISDTGIGFTEPNFESFQTADSRYRAKIGGKGIGRFLWLKAFDHAEINSAFRSDDGTWFQRSFKLSLSPEGVIDHHMGPATEERRSTTVRLVLAHEKYQKALPKSADVVASRIVEHCLQYFLLGMNATITLHDEANSQHIVLDDLFKSQVETLGASVPLDISGRKFNIHHLRVRPTYGDGHRLYFCADKRLVSSEKLESKVPNLDGSLKDEKGRPFVYSGYVSGDFLDESVNPERTDFLMPDENSAFGDPTWSSLLDRASTESQKFLSPYTSAVKQEKEDRIRKFIQTKAPSYRPLLKHRPEILDAIPPNLPDDRLDVELYKHNQTYDISLREMGEKLVESIEGGDEKTIRDTYGKFIQEWNETGIAKLANHVVHRKATLKILRASLSLNQNGKYSLEEAVHKLICPLRTSSDDIPADQMNLWIIDEKLAYHFYLASDVPFKTLKQDVMKMDSNQRSDLLVFNNATAFVDEEAPFSSVVIIEFKRPARNDYVDEENPITQVYRYVRLIREGKATDRKGRPINISSSIPFYAYIVADITTSLREQADFASFRPNHDNSGFFMFNETLRVYVEIISFDQLVNNAERRNQYFFNQLGLPQ